MARIHSIFSFVVLVIAYQASLSNSTPLAVGAIDKVLEIYGMISGAQTWFSQTASLGAGEQAPEFYFRLSEELQKVSRQISDFRNEFKTNTELLQKTLIRKFQIRLDFQNALETLENYFHVINSRYQRFSEIYLRSNETAKITLADVFFRSIIGEDESGLDFKLKMMYLHTNGARKENNIFNLMNRQLQEIELDRCDDPVSSQKYIYNLFTDIVTHELDAFIMIVTGYSYLQKQRQNRQYEIGIDIAINGTRNRLIGYTREAREVLAKASTFIFRCGPTGTDFIQVKGVTQAIVIDGVRWNSLCRGKKKQCVPPNGDHPAGEDVCMHIDGNECLGQSCYSNLINCQTLSHQVEVCKPDGKSNRRYNYVKYYNSSSSRNVEVYYGKKVDGSNGKCQRESAYAVNYMMGSDYCSFCMCTCTDNGWGASDVRTIYHLGQDADISDSKAVIGVRFVEEAGMIHLQIKQGTLLPYGKIDERSAQWKPIRKIRRKLSTNPQSPPEFYDVLTNEKLENYYDYYHFTNNLKTMSLSDVKVPNGYIVTGVGFAPGRQTNLGTGKTRPFEIVLRARPYDFKTGKYVDSPAKPPISTDPWSDGNLYKGGDRAAIKFDEPDVPSRSMGNTLYPGSDQIVTFNITDYEKDAGQTVIPFLDAQAVETIPSTPLSGIGLYFKGQSGYGGFIAPRILTFDANNKIDDKFERLEISRNTEGINELISDYSNKRH